MTEFKTDVVYCSGGDFFYYIEDVPHNPDFAICRESGDDYGYLTIIRKSDLKPREETWQWQQKEKYAAELQAIVDKSQNKLDKLTDKLVDKAIMALASRMKFNVVFGKGGAGNAWALTIVEELEKLIKEKAPEVIKEKDADI